MTRYTLIEKKPIGPNLTQYEIEAPRIAAARECGQFVMVRPAEGAERIPLTVADVNRDRGTITLIVQTVGKTTLMMSQIPVGESFADVAGPMGHPSHLEHYGTVVVVGGGLGTAVVYPQARALREMGNRIITIIGARTRELIILEDQLRSVSDELICTTDDGSYGRKGVVTDALKDLITGGDSGDSAVGAVYCAGPVVMMRFVAETTRPYEIPTIVSLNPIMVDGTGMCGGCRVTVGGKTLFACVDGPEFDGHEVDFQELTDRLTTYKEQEADRLGDYEKKHSCRLQR